MAVCKERLWFYLCFQKNIEIRNMYTAAGLRLFGDKPDTLESSSKSLQYLPAALPDPPDPPEQRQRSVSKKSHSRAVELTALNITELPYRAGLGQRHVPLLKNGIPAGAK